MRKKIVDAESLPIETIVVSDRLRALVPERAQALATSMKEIGLKTPISVRVKNDAPHLIAGQHRLEAARLLGWEDIDCIVLDADDIDAQLWEVDENLARFELTTDEKREHLRRRKELWEEKQVEVMAHRAPKPQGGRPVGFAADTAASTGLSKSQINRLLAEPKPKPEPKPAVLAPDPLNDFESKERQVAALMSAWNKASPEAREEFLGRIDKPVFDNTRAA